MTSYAQSWAKLYRETCEATQVRHEQSADVLDLRMSCLQEPLGAESLALMGSMFTLAHALWESNHERGRARLLANQAKRGYERSPDKDQGLEVDTWLRQHGALSTPQCPRLISGG